MNQLTCISELGFDGVSNNQPEVSCLTAAAAAIAGKDMSMMSDFMSV